MASVDPDVLKRLDHHDEYYTAKELVRFLERNHPSEEPGIPRDLVEEYAERLDYDMDRLRTSLDDRLTSARTWQPGNRLYEIDDSVSIYPRSWHEQLADTTDVSKFVEVMLESVKAPAGVEFDEADLGIRQEDLLTAIEVIADVDRATARNLLKTQRLEGSVVLYAFQNPEEVVRLPEDRTE